MPHETWYAGYGSNLSRQRFLCYLAGGIPAFGMRKHKGSRDATAPAESRLLVITHSLYFALPEGGTHTENWGAGGVAFIDPDGDPDTKTICRIWRITRAQYEDVRVQEGLSWYDKEVMLGEADGLPILTVTHACRLEHLVAPSAAYLRTIAVGLRETAGLSDEEIADYLHDKAGIKGRIPKTEMGRLLADRA